MGKFSKSIWNQHTQVWRHPAQVVSGWMPADHVDRVLLDYHTEGPWWSLLAELGITLLVSREYEHLLMGLTTLRSRPWITYQSLPHPSGIAVNRKSQAVYIASTRNPNQIFQFKPLQRTIKRGDRSVRNLEDRPLLPKTSTYLPGCTYTHDLAVIKDKLYLAAVGENAIVELTPSGHTKKVWWPRCIEKKGRPDFSRNYLQLNSIAPNENISKSVFSASTDKISSRVPGDKNFPVDGRGVIFSARTREPIVRGLTRPHSARFEAGKIWVDNSGYGETGIGEDGRFTPVVKLPGWTRGLAFYRGVAFVGTSRIIPAYRQYAPGVDDKKAVCGVHAIDIKTGKRLASLIWPHGNQIFSVDWILNSVSTGFPFVFGRNGKADRSDLFYSYSN